MSILFGILAMMFLLDVRLKNLEKKQLRIFITGNLLILALNAVLSGILGMDQHMKFYLAFVHLPHFLIFWVTTRIMPVKVLFAQFTAVFLIFPVNIVMVIVSRHMAQFGLPALYVAGLSMYALMLLIIYRLLKADFNYLIRSYSRLNFFKLCLLPLTYNVSNYWLGLYNYSAAISSERYAMRVLLFFLTLTAYLLILDIAKSAREKDLLQSAQMALTLQLESANHQLSVLQSTQEQAVVYRHDLRHHFSLIGGYLEKNHPKEALEYVRQAQTDIEDFTPNRYSANNAFNLILSAFDAKAKAGGVALAVSADLPRNLTVSETELCALLANGLENAIAAAARVEAEAFRTVRLNCHLHKGNLLILIENSFTGQVVMKDGLPQSQAEGHGFGVKSMALIAEKHNGYCSFAAKDGIFTLKIVLPPDSAGR